MLPPVWLGDFQDRGGSVLKWIGDAIKVSSNSLDRANPPSQRLKTHMKECILRPLTAA